ncbi:MAG: mitochondrial carrier domain-containing protein, partial [Olpidium bornovanus]
DRSTTSVVGNTIRTFRSVRAEQGLPGLYRGLSAGVAGAAASWGLYFYFYSELKNALRTQATFAPDAGAGTPAQPPLTAARYLFASGAAGAVTALLTNPLWVVKTRMCTTAGTEPGAYRGLAGELLFLSRAVLLRAVAGAADEGPKGYYRGIVPALFGVSHGALQFMAYEKLKIWRSPNGTKPEELVGAASVSCPFSVRRAP